VLTGDVSKPYIERKLEFRRCYDLSHDLILE
jgi:hypothetical protein